MSGGCHDSYSRTEGGYARNYDTRQNQEISAMSCEGASYRFVSHQNQCPGSGASDLSFTVVAYLATAFL